MMPEIPQDDKDYISQCCSKHTPHALVQAKWYDSEKRCSIYIIDLNKKGLTSELISTLHLDIKSKLSCPPKIQYVHAPSKKMALQTWRQKPLKGYIPIEHKHKPNALEDMALCYTHWGWRTYGAAAKADLVLKQGTPVALTALYKAWARHQTPALSMHPPQQVGPLPIPSASEYPDFNERLNAIHTFVSALNIEAGDAIYEWLHHKALIFNSETSQTFLADM